MPGNIIIPTTNLNAVPVSAALEAVLKGTDVSLSWDTSGFDDHLVKPVDFGLLSRCLAGLSGGSFAAADARGDTQ